MDFLFLLEKWRRSSSRCRTSWMLRRKKSLSQQTLFPNSYLLYVYSNILSIIKIEHDLFGSQSKILCISFDPWTILLPTTKKSPIEFKCIIKFNLKRILQTSAFPSSYSIGNCVEVSFSVSA